MQKDMQCNLEGQSSVLGLSSQLGWLLKGVEYWVVMAIL